jgi:hypothetical protein
MPACPECKPIDVGRCNGLGQQEDAGKHLGASESPCVCVETGPGSLGVSYTSNDVTVKNDLATGGLPGA